MVGMHLLQCTQRPSRSSPACQRASRSGSRSKARPRRDQLEPVLQRRVHRVEPVDPTEEDERQRQGGTELAGVGQEVRLLEGVARQESLAEQLEGRADRLRERGGHLRDRGVAAEEVHRVPERAATGELDGVQDTVGLQQLRRLDALLEPDAAGVAVGHVELRQHRHVGTGRLAHRAGDPPRELGPVGDAAAPLVAPPVERGAQERAEQVVVPQVELDRVEAGVRATAPRPGRSRR